MENTNCPCLQGALGCRQKAMVRRTTSQATGKPAAPATHGQWQTNLWLPHGRGRLRGQGPVGKCEKATGVGATCGPGAGDWGQLPANPPRWASPEVTVPSAAIFPSVVPHVHTYFFLLHCHRGKIRNSTSPRQVFHSLRPRVSHDQSQTLAMTAPEAKRSLVAKPSRVPAWHSNQGPRRTRFR